MEEELRLELGRRLRAQRAAQGRTLASVAVEAGLSVPYVANLENGRGNPTLSSMHGLAQALGISLAELLLENPDEGNAPVPPASLLAFAARTRFRTEVERIARETGSDPSRLRHQMLLAMAAMATLPGRFDEFDWHRVLDLIVLLQHPR